MDNRTLPLERKPRLSVRTLGASVLSGPDEKKSVEAETEILTVGTAEDNTLTVTDPTVSGYHLELKTTASGIEVCDLGSTNGTFIGDLRISKCVCPLGTTVRIGRTSIKVQEGGGSVVDIHEDDELGELRGATPSMRRLMAQVRRVARAPVGVLLYGESGTGKELVARGVHENSERAGKPFVTLDCGALTPTLVASALFGHERGAFTGADRQYAGVFERADGGTVFLDEIGELPQELQPQLLGVLERRRFTRLGGKSEIAVDVRVVCATNRDLREAVNAGVFRADLYFRIAVVTLKLPSLRERLDDIPLLMEHFLRELGSVAQVGEVFPEEVLESLRKHHWPGNVRELRNFVEATVAMGEAPRLSYAGQPAQDAFSVGDTVLELPYGEARGAVLAAFESKYLKALLETCEDNVSRAARVAQMDRSYLIKLLQKHGLR